MLVGTLIFIAELLCRNGADSFEPSKWTGHYVSSPALPPSVTYERLSSRPSSIFTSLSRIAVEMLLPIKWSSTTYGLDGPWQAVTVQVGGYDQPAGDQPTVDLLPGGSYDSFIPSSASCKLSNATQDCGKGGTWNPLTMDNGQYDSSTGAGMNISFIPITNDPATGTFAAGKVYQQQLRLNGAGNGQYPGFIVPNSTLVSTDITSQNWPNGRKTSTQLGNLGLGVGDETQNFDNIATFNIPGYLRNISKGSNSYSLQIGSALVGYTGSLIYGGYDKGRGLGPTAAWTSSSLQLNDVVLGVETGGSPWNFSSKSGLLYNNISAPGPVPVTPNSLAPALHLPSATCQQLAQVLPIYYDNSAHYYLWNTSDSAYSKTIGSAAYLGFVFPAAGSGSNFTIKVPMLYLNLTLMPAASGLSNAVQYFPCQPFQPQDNNAWVLGRAFLQSAFIGANWEPGIGINWLAQAPGPGSSKQGLGYTPTEIGNSDSSITFDSDLTKFSQSMSGYWSPLPGGTSNSTNGTSDNTSSSQGGLSTGAQAGIGVGVAVAALIVLAILAFFFIRARKRKRNQQTNAASTWSEHIQESKPPMYDHQPAPSMTVDHMPKQQHNYGYHQGPVGELSAHPTEPSELSSARD